MNEIILGLTLCTTLAKMSSFLVELLLKDRGQSLPKEELASNTKKGKISTSILIGLFYLRTKCIIYIFILNIIIPK